jgi:RNA 3'-terminal phosphate cyclase (ATP)
MESRERGMVEIDGSYGEGGGQILRSALAFSAILKRPLVVHHIRARRKNPGLRPQHLKGVEALAQITEAEVQGAHIGSEAVTFIPKGIIPGDYRFEVGNGKRSAGSATLLLQTLLPPLCFSREPSQLTLVGGTHVPWSPSFHYLSEVLFPTLYSMGISVEASIDRWGWYPQGGGIIRAEIRPSPSFRPISLLDRGLLKKIRGLSATSNLPRHVAERQKDYALRRIEREMKMDAEIAVLDHASGSGPGSFFFLVAESEKAIAGFSSLGERGKPAEEVAKEALDSLRDYTKSDGCIDPHLSDQLVPFIVLAKGSSAFTTTRITEHLLTNLWVMQHFFDVRISRLGERGENGKVEVFNE